MTVAGPRLRAHPIRTPDQRLRVFVSSTLGELAPEREAVRLAIERLHLTPVLFERGARPHPPRELYRAYLEQSHVFLGIYWQRYGWVAPGEARSGLEDEYRLAGDRPRLLYIKEPAPERDDGLTALIADLRADDLASYKRFSTADELAAVVEDDLAVLLSERFESPSGGATRGPPRPASTVPVPLTETLGRTADVQAVVGVLRGGRRLVTLMGPGGVGKTRLAVEVALAAQQFFPDGAHLVPLSAVADPAEALHAVLDRVGGRAEGGTPSDALAAALRDRRALLVLDNVEQIDGLGPALAELLERVPRTQVLVTSRHALRVRGEWPYPVSTLPLPDRAASAGEVASSPAVALLVERARAVSPAFALTPANAEAVVDVVRRLDGLPLGIELAAAQLRVLSPEALRDRVTSVLDGATAPAPDLPERQRTLRATISWSEGLLSDEERALFARLSVFAGGWTVDAAEAVCDTGDGPVVEALAALLDKSLVIPDQEETSGEPRFRMLVPVRTHAQDRLRERGEEQALRRSHLVWVRALGERAQPGLCGPGQPQWVARMAPERANLRAAVATALDLGELAEVVELAWDVVVLYFMLDAVEEPDAWLRRVLEASWSLDEVTEAKLRSLHALTRIHHGDFGGADAALTDALQVFSVRGMAFEEAVVLHQLGFVRYHVDGDVAAAADSLTRSSMLFAEIGHDWGVALAEAMLGSVRVATGDLDAAEAHQRRSLERARTISSDQQVVQALGQLALVRLLKGQDQDALDLLTESTPPLLRWGYRTEAANALESLAVVAHHRGDDATAALALCAAAAQRRALGVPPWPTLQPFIDETRRAVRHSLGEAAFAEVVDRAGRVDAVDAVREILDRSTSPAPSAPYQLGHGRFAPGVGSESECERRR